MKNDIVSWVCFSETSQTPGGGVQFSTGFFFFGEGGDIKKVGDNPKDLPNYLSEYQKNSYLLNVSQRFSNEMLQ